MQILETDESGKTVADLTHIDGVGPHVTVLGMATGGGAAESYSEVQPVCVDPVGTCDGTAANAVEDKGRPSLDVAIETLGHLRPRIEALCLRLLGWDKREMNAELRTAFEDSVERFEKNAATLATALELLRNKGFVAKTTDKTRKSARMKPGTRVVLSDPAMAADFLAIYSPLELDDLEVVRAVGSKVFLKTGAREVGLVDVGKVEVRS
jgi:hypothetical protein